LRNHVQRPPPHEPLDHLNDPGVGHMSLRIPKLDSGFRNVNGDTNPVISFLLKTPSSHDIDRKAELFKAAILKFLVEVCYPLSCYLDTIFLEGLPCMVNEIRS